MFFSIGSSKEVPTQTYKTATKLRAFFLALLKTIKNSVTTNMQVLQASGFLKYRALFGFLKRQAEPVAKEIQDSYTAAARTYYETAFRRYIRSLSSLRVSFRYYYPSIHDQRSLGPGY